MSRVREVSDAWVEADCVCTAVQFAERYMAGDLYAVPAAADRADEIARWMRQAADALRDRCGCFDLATLDAARAVIVAVEQAAIGGVLRVRGDYVKGFAEGMRAVGRPGDLTAPAPAWARPVERARLQS